MAKFRKKPVVIDAWRVDMLLDRAANNWYALPLEIIQGYEKGEVIFHPDGIDVRTLEGVMTAGKADWVILGIAGELYPCKDDIFRATYEVVESPKVPGPPNPPVSTHSRVMHG